MKELADKAFHPGVNASAGVMYSEILCLYCPELLRYSSFGEVSPADLILLAAKRDELVGEVSR